MAIASAAARSPISLDVLRRDGYGSVDLLSTGRNRLFVPAQINGHKVDLLLDTGWGAPGITVSIDPSALQITPEKGGHMMVSANGVRTLVGQGMAKSVVLGNVQINGAPIFFGRFAGQGYLGRGFLKKNHAVIDLANRRLYLRPPGKGRTANLAVLSSLGMAAAPFSETPSGSFIVHAEVNGVPAEMALDTGAQISVLDVRFAKVAGAKGWGRRNVRQIDAAGTASDADFAGPKTFKIAGVPIRTPTVFVSRFAGYDYTQGKLAGALGLDVIGMNWGIIDFAQQKFYFAGAK